MSKSLIYAGTLNINANTSQILNFNITGNTSYEVQFQITGQGQVTPDTVITVFGTDSSGNVIHHQKVLYPELTQISQINP
ncbi:hypothetical protein [Bacillus sp. OTU530]|uniref:hypothetical protein n=1 Tax=Bacillus sp. OTU530 TaxID=3043862 RepID=UPI00313C4A3F